MIVTNTDHITFSILKLGNIKLNLSHIGDIEELQFSAITDSYSNYDVQFFLHFRCTRVHFRFLVRYMLPDFQFSVYCFVSLCFYFFFWQLYCLSFDLPLPITPLVSSNFSFTRHMDNIESNISNISKTNKTRNIFLSCQ